MRLGSDNGYERSRRRSHGNARPRLGPQSVPVTGKRPPSLPLRGCGPKVTRLPTHRVPRVPFRTPVIHVIPTIWDGGQSKPAESQSVFEGPGRRSSENLNFTPLLVSFCLTRHAQQFRATQPCFPNLTTVWGWFTLHTLARAVCSNQPAGRTFQIPHTDGGCAAASCLLQDEQNGKRLAASCP